MREARKLEDSPLQPPPSTTPFRLDAAETTRYAAGSATPGPSNQRSVIIPGRLCSSAFSASDRSNLIPTGSSACSRRSAAACAPGCSRCKGKHCLKETKCGGNASAARLQHRKGRQVVFETNVVT